MLLLKAHSRFCYRRKFYGGNISNYLPLKIEIYDG